MVNQLLHAGLRFERSGLKYWPCHCIVFSQCLCLPRVGTDKFNVGGKHVINKTSHPGKEEVHVQLNS